MKSKEALLASSEAHKISLKKEIHSITESTGDVLKKAAIAGGIALGAYIVYQLFSSEKPSKKKKNKAELSEAENDTNNSAAKRVLKVLSQHAVLYLLKESKDQLSDYLNELEKK